MKIDSGEDGKALSSRTAVGAKESKTITSDYDIYNWGAIQ